MNRFTQGALAVSAGTALLLGGAGSFALWQDTVSITSSAITAGSMTLNAVDAGVWKNVTPGHEGVIDDPSAFRIVPGNTLEYARTLRVNAAGDNLVAKLEHSGPKLVGTFAGLAASVNVELGEIIEDSGDIEVDVDNGIITSVGTGSFFVNVVVTVSFPSGVDGLDDQSASASLRDLDFTLSQQDPSIALP